MTAIYRGVCPTKPYQALAPNAAAATHLKDGLLMRLSSKLVYEKKSGRSGWDHDDRVPHEHEVFMMGSGARSPSARSATILDPDGSSGLLDQPERWRG